MNQSQNTISICLTGARGKMGTAIANSLAQTDDLKLVATVDRSNPGASLRESAGQNVPDIQVYETLEYALKQTRPDVVVDFSHQSTTVHYALESLKNHIPIIIGTSGLSQSDLNQIKEASADSQTTAFVVPNFAIGSVLQMKFSELTARWMPQTEIIELHHDRKADAPSGTAMKTAEVIVSSRDSKRLLKKRMKLLILKVPEEAIFMEFIYILLG